MRVTYHTFGCKANQYDTERMRQAVEARGATTVDRGGRPELWVVNTCTVTNQADADARRYIRRIRKENPDAKILVAGCSAALKPDDYRAMQGVEAVVAGHDPEAVAVAAVATAPTAMNGEASLVQISLNRPLQRMHVEPVGGALLRERRGRTRGWLKVQDGCDRKCAFCATRLARGASRSRSSDEVVAEAQLLAERHPEIVITGVHIGHYGIDLNPTQTLSGLVERLLNEVPSVRLRLGSIEATEVDDRLIELLSDSGGRLAPHLHMPLQSGADPVLRRMRRWHTREAYRKRTRQIAEALPRLGLGADVITGFPGETDDDHARSRALIDELPFTYLHVFPYSPRSGTIAADLDATIPQRIAGDRARELRELGHRKGEAYVQSRVGEPVEVVREGGDSGLTEDYFRVSLRAGTTGAPATAVRGPDGLLRATLQMAPEGPYIEAAPTPPA